MNLVNAKFEASYGLDSQLPESIRKEIVFCGRSNVGKSTLINKLTRRNGLARVSATPGKTTTINCFGIDSDFCLMDLPGYGYAKRPRAEIVRWGRLLERYFTTDRRLALGVLLVDSRREVLPDDVVMLECFNRIGLKYIVVITKADKLKPAELLASIKNIEFSVAPFYPTAVMSFSQNGEDPAREIRDRITELCGEESNER